MRPRDSPTTQGLTRSYLLESLPGRWPPPFTSVCEVVQSSSPIKGGDPAASGASSPASPEPPSPGLRPPAATMRLLRLLLLALSLLLSQLGPGEPGPCSTRGWTRGRV